MTKINLTTTQPDKNAETINAQSGETGFLPLSGGTLTGPVYADGHFRDGNNQTLSQPNGNAIDGNQFYTQLAQDQSGNLFGRLIMKKDNNWSCPLECTPEGKLTNINKKSLALIDDVNAETSRAQAAEAGKVSTVSFSDADARTRTIRTLKNGSLGHPSLIVEHDGYGDVWYASEEYARNVSGSGIIVVDPGNHTGSRIHQLSFRITGIRSDFYGRIKFPSPIEGAGNDGSELVANPQNVQIQTSVAGNPGGFGCYIGTKTVNGVLIADITNNDFMFSGNGVAVEKDALNLFVTVTYWSN